MKNKISKYDFLIVGGGLIGALTALALFKKNYKVLVLDKNNDVLKDKRTLAVNANSKEFLEELGIWNSIKSNPQIINKIIINDYINSSPLVFINKNEPMGNVILNRELHEIVRKKLKNLKILKTNINIKFDNIIPNKPFKIKNNNYLFKKIIISIGKNINSESAQKSIIFDKGHYSYVGFFKHENNHKNIAYEFFKKDGPLAILPTPYFNKKKSTFIFSTNKKISKLEIFSIIKKDFKNSHGRITFDGSISKFPITPHLKKYNKNHIYVGDSLRSIHPVAGQGWNLGIKDIQTLCKLTDQYKLDSKIFDSIYYSRRILESTLYLGFTSFINFVYENQHLVNKIAIKTGYKSLSSLSFVRELFVKQAMGRINLID